MKSGLVLGGGGIAAIAWETGILAGLADWGLRLWPADVVVATSGGSTVAAQLASNMPIDRLYARQLGGYAADEPRIEVDVDDLLARTRAAIGQERDPVRLRQLIGQLALSSQVPDEAWRRSLIARRLPAPHWPDIDLRITAVDAHTGEFVTFTRNSGVALVDAVAASSAVPGVWPPVTIGGSRYIDGGVRSGTNADAAGECDRVLVLEAMRLPANPDVRSPAGSVLVLEPDRHSREARGRTALDADIGPPSAAAGYRQGRDVRDDVARFWSFVGR